MQRFSKTFKIFLAVFLAVFSSGLVQLYAAPTAKAAPKEKVTFCHYEGNDTWHPITAAPEIVFTSGHDTHQDRKDIIPDFEYVKQGETLNFPGLNYDAAGQAILANGCVVPALPVTPTVCTSFPVTHATNLAPNGWTLGNGASFVEGGLKLSVPGNWIESTATRPLTGTLKDLGTDITFEPNVAYLGLHVTTSKGVLVYERESSYAGNWWSSSDFGVASGMGYATFDSLTNIVAANPDVTLTSLTILYTNPVAAETTVTSVSIGCARYTFDYEEVQPEVTPLPSGIADVCGRANDTVPLAGLHHTVKSDTGWVADNGDLVKTIRTIVYETESGYVFPNGLTEWSYRYTDWGTPCSPTIPESPKVPTEGVCEQIVAGRTIRNLGSSDVNVRDKNGEGGEVNADSWATTYRLYGATNTDLKNVTLTFTATQGMKFVPGSIGEVLTATNMGMLDDNGYTVAATGIGQPTLSLDGKTITLTVLSMPAKSAIAFNVSYELDGSGKSMVIDSLMEGTLVLCGGSGGGGGQIDGEAATTTAAATALPTTLPATGPVESNNPLLVIFAAIFAYGATFFVQNRREIQR